MVEIKIRVLEMHRSIYYGIQLNIKMVPPFGDPYEVWSKLMVDRDSTISKRKEEGF